MDTETQVAEASVSNINQLFTIKLNKWKHVSIYEFKPLMLQFRVVVQMQHEHNHKNKVVESSNAERHDDEFLSHSFVCV